MHLYFITRGIKQQRDSFVTFMQAQMFRWKRKNLASEVELKKKSDDDIKEILFKTGIVFPEYNREKAIEFLATEHMQVQGSLRPVELWEYVFPEECLPEVLTALEIKPEDRAYNNDLGIKGKIKKLGNKTKLAMLRKTLGAEEIPEYTPVQTNRYIEKRSVAIHPIGIKKDRQIIIGGYEHEAL